MMGHEFEFKNGEYWCLDENVISESCTDTTRCNNECVCNPFPRPNRKIGESIVIASVYYRDLTEEDRRNIPWDDDWPDEVYTVVLLNKQPPYYTVALVAYDEGSGEHYILQTDNDYMNIVHAIEDGYTQWGGDI